MNMDIHSYRNVHDENPYTKKWIVIRTKMYMTKPIRILIVIRKEMSMTKTHKRILLIVIRTKLCMTKTHTKTYVNMDIQSTKLYLTKHTTELIQLVK